MDVFDKEDAAVQTPKAFAFSVESILSGCSSGSTGGGGGRRKIIQMTGGNLSGEGPQPKRSKIEGGGKWHYNSSYDNNRLALLTNLSYKYMQKLSYSSQSPF
jgi:hypothetical protein